MTDHSVIDNFRWFNQFKSSYLSSVGPNKRYYNNYALEFKDFIIYQEEKDKSNIKNLFKNLNANINSRYYIRSTL